MLIVKRQKGFTITELMVALLVGLFIMGGVMTIYVSMLKSSRSVLDGSRLNQEMMAIMTIMANDIRRAGFWDDGDFQLAQDNPFNAVESAASTEDISALRVHDNGGSGTAYNDVTYNASKVVDVNSKGSCIVYTYDADKEDGLDNDNTPFATDGDDDDEEFGFRWDGTPDDALMMRASNNTTGPNKCGAGSGNWQSINDVDDIVITNLEFDLSDSTCLNATTETDCYVSANVPAVGSEERTVEVRNVLITLEAELADDPNVKAFYQQTVQVRNNLVRVR